MIFTTLLFALVSLPGDSYPMEVGAPDLKPWAAKAHKELVIWYPKIADLLGVKQRQPARPITIVILNHADGVAWTEGDKITVNGDYVRKHPNDVGLIVHEEAHVVQSYSKPGSPGWLVEGVADYVRWFFYEPKDKRPKINKSKAKYEQGYQVAASFLFWATNKFDHNFIKELDATMKSGTYSAGIWKSKTGHPLDELWSLFLDTQQGQS